jgi:hypothetical protein
LIVGARFVRLGFVSRDAGDAGYEGDADDPGFLIDGWRAICSLESVARTQIARDSGGLARGLFAWVRFQ